MPASASVTFVIASVKSLSFSVSVSFPKFGTICLQGCVPVSPRRLSGEGAQGGGGGERKREREREILRPKDALGDEYESMLGGWRLPICSLSEVCRGRE